VTEVAPGPATARRGALVMAALRFPAPRAQPAQAGVLAHSYLTRFPEGVLQTKKRLPTSASKQPWLATMLMSPRHWPTNTSDATRQAGSSAWHARQRAAARP